MDDVREPGLSCPLPLRDLPNVLLAHGGGGSLAQELLDGLFLPAFRNPPLEARHDGAVVTLDRIRLAFTTDSFVVKPIVFPGGDIGSLAVNGTVNDLAMCGARPLHLSAGFILEEGLPMELLRRVVASMGRAAAEAGVMLVTGDTKVVERGKGDGIYINTSGIGLLEHAREIAPSQVRPGDAVILSGDVGRHGIAIMASREGLEFDTTIESDCAPLAAAVGSLLAAGLEVHCLRDLTRGGLATALVEIAETAGLALEVDEREIPVAGEVRAACELLGLDPLYVANEGRFVCVLPEEQAGRALALLRTGAAKGPAARIGGFAPAKPGGARRGAAGLVSLRSPIGTARIVDRLSGEQLPRIC